MKRKYLVLLCGLALVGALAGCSKKNAPDVTPTPSAATPSESVRPSETVKPTDTTAPTTITPTGTAGWRTTPPDRTTTLWATASRTPLMTPGMWCGMPQRAPDGPLKRSVTTSPDTGKPFPAHTRSGTVPAALSLRFCRPSSGQIPFIFLTEFIQNMDPFP